MTTILIVEDDEVIRRQLVRLLGGAGYHTLDCADGALALAQARRRRPDVVVSDVSMPELDGYGLVEAMRADPALAATPVMLLTALDERSSMRRGMAAGADDFLAKPFRPAELLEAVAGLLRKQERVADRIESAVAARVATLRRQLATSAEQRRSDEYGLAAAADAVVDRQVQGTVLFADIRNFTALAELLRSGEVAELLGAYFEHVCEPVLGNGGQHLKLMGDGLMSVFLDEVPGGALPAARRAVAASLGIAVATHRFRDWVDQRFAGRDLPPFAIGVGLHAGEVTLCRLGTPQNMEVTPIGDTVNVAARLESASKELGWTVVASTGVLAGAGAGIQTGGTASLALRGRSEDVDVVEVTGLAPGAADRGPGMAPAHAVRTAVEVNSAMAADAPEGSPVTVVADSRREPGAL